LLGLPDPCRGQLLPALVRNAELRAILESLERRGPAVTAEVALDDRRLLVRGQPLAPTRESAGTDEAPAAIIAIVDLTEMRRLEGVRRDFVANVSHELKTPLTSIRGYAETLLSDELDATTQKQFIEVIQKNADRLHTMVDDLLDLSRLESGGWTPTLVPVSVAAIVTESWNEFAERAREKHITLVAPPADTPVLADESALHQILSNLFDNAIRHTGPGGSIRVTIRPDAGPRADDPLRAIPRRTGPLVAIEVQDNGSGIPSDALPRIFERFYRVDPARSRTEGGTGLGLSIVKHMVESMNGDVSAASELGKGTTIRVRLPAAA
jgi:two-component system phosphate regulon sensor histidine kinase PhoR